MTTEDKVIPIRCTGSRYVHWDRLLTFQGELKEMKEADFDKFRALLLKYGWIAPIYCWDDKVLTDNTMADGHGRLLVLKELIHEGYSIDKIPVCDIQAKDTQEAAGMLLAINSKFQKITPQGLYEFTHNFKIDLPTLETFKLPDINFEKFKTEFHTETNDEGNDATPENKIYKHLYECPSCGHKYTKDDK